MSVVHFTFDPEGDLLLRLQYPTEGEDIQNDSEAPFLTSSESTPTSPPTVSNSDHPSSARAGRVAHMLVSSRHLILASPVFKAMFRSGFRESHLLASQELAEIDLPEDDPGAFEILLNIIHGHVRKVPEHVDLKELVELSILIDKYQLLDIMKLYIQMWMSRLRDSAPRTYTADILPWLTISWVFKLQDDFKAISKLAEQGSSNRLCDNKTRLPIPNTVLDKIDATRQQGISRIIASIKTVISRYNTGTVFCQAAFAGQVVDLRFACDSLVLGTVMKSLSTHGLWPLPEAPYKDLSISKLAQDVRDFKIFAVCDQGRFFRFTHSVPPGHGWIKFLQDVAGNALLAANGQDLWVTSLAENSFEAVVTGL